MGNIYDIAGNTPTTAGTDETLTLDYFKNEMKTKTQRADFYEPQPEPDKTDIDPNLIDPEHEADRADEQPGDGTWRPETEQPAPINPERFHRTGENIARLIDTAFDFSMTNFVVRDKTSQKSYKASEKDINDLADAWSDIAEEKQWDLGPGWRLLLLYVIVYGPLAKQAIADRRLLELERRADETEEKINIQDARIKELENELYKRNNGTNTGEGQAKA